MNDKNGNTVAGLLVDHLSLGDLIEALEQYHPARVVPIGFANPHSYRGYYDQLAFEPCRDVTIGSMLDAAKAALGETFQGYKGGEYAMKAHTECWLAYEGSSDGETLGRLLLALLLDDPRMENAS